MHDRAFHETLGTELRRRRTELGLKQVELAELAGCSTRFVHAAEAGKQTLRLDKLLLVMGVLGLRLEVKAAASAPVNGETNHPGPRRHGSERD